MIICDLPYNYQLLKTHILCVPFVCKLQRPRVAFHSSDVSIIPPMFPSILPTTQLHVKNTPLASVTQAVEQGEVTGVIHSRASSDILEEGNW